MLLVGKRTGNVGTTDTDWLLRTVARRPASCWSKRVGKPVRV